MNNSLQPRIRKAGRSCSSGFSLIELMVAILITMVVTAGAIAVFGNMRSTFSNQDRLSQLQDSQRLVLTVLGTTVQSAGYYVAPLTKTAATALPRSSENSDGSVFPVGTGIVGTAGSGANLSDVLNVRYQSLAGDSLMNCQGVANTAAGTTKTWANTFGVNASNQLTCQVDGGTAVPMIDNVYSMTVRYLVKSDATSMYAYKTATEVASASEWGNVYGTEVTIKFVDTTNPGAPSALATDIVQNINLMNKS